MSTKNEMNAWPWFFAYFLFIVFALLISWDDQLVQFDRPIGIARIILIIVWLGFLAYSTRCLFNENLFETVDRMTKLFWGRQILLDLYLSVFLSVALVYLVTGSLLLSVVWSLAFLAFVNLAILPFVILYLDKIVTPFLS